MNKISVGDTVAFRREIVGKCESDKLAQFRAVVTDIAGDWLFIKTGSGEPRVMPKSNMCKVAHNGAVLELV